MKAVYNHPAFRRDDWLNLVKRGKIPPLIKASQAPSKLLGSNEGGGYEELEADKPSHLVCACPPGLDSRQTCMADESRLCGSLQLPSVLSLLFQQTRRAPALRVQHGRQSARRVLGQH